MFYITTCYSETTPESVEDCAFSDRGFVEESERLTLSELLDRIESDGFVYTSSFPSAGPGDWLAAGYHVEDYGTLTEREETLHLDLERSSARAVRLWVSILEKTIDAQHA